MRISILLPYKENFSADSAGAVSLFVNQILKKSIYRDNTNVFGNTEAKDHLDPCYINIEFKKNFLKSSSKIYVEKFLDNKFVSKSNIIEIHNRPNYVKFIKKRFDKNIFLYFHNDPLTMEGSSKIIERKYLLENVDELIFNSNWSKNRFFSNLDISESLYTHKIHICFQSSDKVKINFKKKKKIICFIGKLNSAKGYDIFGNSIIEILNKYKDWKATVIGHEEREKINFNHPNLQILGFKNNQFVLDYLKNVSISVVCSRWEEPFGRVSLESTSRGAAVILSNRGGLLETTKHAIVLKKLNKNELVKKISILINNKKLLLTNQKTCYKNFYLTHSYVAKIIDKVRNNYKLKINLIKKKSILRIIHITNFNNRFNGRLHYNTSKRINNGFIRLGHNVLTISDRDIISNNRNFNDIKGTAALESTIINNIKNFNPDLIVIGHADSISLKTFDFIKSKKIKTCQWFLDPIGNNTPDFRKNRKRVLKNINYVDASFLTTDPHVLGPKLDNTYFMPNPSDASFETLNNYNKKCVNDVFFAMSHGVHRGKLKTGKVDGREIFLRKLIKKNKNINFDIFGMDFIEPIWGENFMKAVSNSSMGLNLSRGLPTKYYSSDRLVQLIGNGLLTFIDKKTQLNDFFSDNEVIFYDNLNDLSYKLNKYKKDFKIRNLIAKNGKNKYMKYFNSTLVCQFLINKTLKYNYKNKFFWEK